MTRYILDKRYRLRGWYKLPTGIYDTSRRKDVFLDPKVYELLLKCDADHDFDEDSLSDDQKRMLGKLERKGGAAHLFAPKIVTMSHIRGCSY